MVVEEDEEGNNGWNLFFLNPLLFLMTTLFREETVALTTVISLGSYTLSLTQRPRRGFLL